MIKNKLTKGEIVDEIALNHDSFKNFELFTTRTTVGE